MYRVWFIFVLGCYSCSGVIYHLNDTEYQRMPPLSKLDEYESCLGEKGGVYCFMQLSLHADPGNELMRMITDYSNHKIKHYNHSIIDRGVCVRKTCQKFINSLDTTVDIKSSLEACFNESLWREYGLHAKVSTLYYCDQHNEAMNINALDWIVLAVILGFVIMNVVGSIYDFVVSTGSNKGNAYLLHFSVIRNWKSLISNESSNPNFPDFRAACGVRVISSVCVILSHVMLFIATGHTTNPHDFEKTYELPLYQLIYNGLLYVQLFFFISGFLTVFYIQIEEQTRTFTAWDILKLILFRFIRLSPTLAMTLAFSLTWVRHVGSGPLWNLYVTGSLVADCRKYWWHTLLFINNYMPENKYCLIPTWHIATDMQVLIVGITVYILTSRRQRYWVLGGLLLLSSAACAFHTIQIEGLDQDPTVILTPEFYRTLESPAFRFLHILGHNNMPCFIIGMVTAAFFFEWQKKGYFSNNKLNNYLLYLSVISFPLIFYSGHVFYNDVERPSPLFRAMYGFCIRPVLGLLCVIATPGLLTETKSAIRSMLEWRYWRVPSRLSYCVYLLHMVFVHVMLGARKQLTDVSFYNLVTAFVFITLLSYLIAIPVYLLVEVPCAKAFKSLMGKNTLPINEAKAKKM